MCIRDSFKALHIGPEDTPFSHGYYFIQYNISDRYPFVPPKAKTITQGDGVRFHPHLYTSGKICLSLLNTWSGEKWEASQTLLSIMNVLHSMIFVKYPLNCEPGFSAISITDKRNVDYNLILKYANIKIAILNNLENIPRHFECLSLINISEPTRHLYI